jgi:hypothetical protein
MIDIVLIWTSIREMKMLATVDLDRTETSSIKSFDSCCLDGSKEHCISRIVTALWFRSRLLFSKTNRQTYNWSNIFYHRRIERHIENSWICN